MALVHDVLKLKFPQSEQQKERIWNKTPTHQQMFTKAESLQGSQ